MWGAWKSGECTFTSVSYKKWPGFKKDEVGPWPSLILPVAASLGLILFLPMLSLHWPYHLKKSVKRYDLNTFP